jgi:transcriptional regulator with XRE-family HTH domain
MSFAEKLRQLRRARPWTQQRLSDKSGVSTRTITALETGRQLPHPETLEKLADALGVNPSDLATADEIARPGPRPRDRP